MRNDRGYLYILSNSSLKYNDLYKIGVTKNSPQDRCAELSRSTAIPQSFTLEYSKEVHNIFVAESRIHLLLKEYRYQSNKEFFRINIDLAKEVISKVIDHLTYHDIVSETIGLRGDLNMSLILNTYKTMNNFKLFNMLLASTRGNTMLDQIFGLPENIADGFLSSSQLSEFIGISNIRAIEIIKEFVEGYQYRKIKLETGVNVPVFKYIRYGNGELIWLFTNEFRKLFINHMIE